MIKRFTITLLMVLFIGAISFGQYTASLSPQTATASPNEYVAFDLNVTGLTNINSFSLYIQVDPAVLTFINPTNFMPSQESNFTWGLGSGGASINFAWTSITPVTFPDGRLLTMNFRYNGLSSPVAFIPLQCEVTRLVGSTPVELTGTFTDAAISPYLLNAAQAHIGSVTGTPGNPVPVPVTHTWSSANPVPTIGAFTQRIAYDAAKLTYINVAGSGITASASSGVVTITWSSPSGIAFNAFSYTINFMYNSSSTANISFSTGCVVTTTGNANVPVTYNNGKVELYVAPTSFASLAPPITNVVQGQTVDVPLTFTTMPAGTNNFDVNLTYDYPRMEFIGIVDSPPPMFPVTVNFTPGAIRLLYTNTADPAPSINGEFLKLRFRYNGIGTAHINFAAGCQFSITTGGGSTQVVVGYTNGSVSPAISAINADIAIVSATSPATVPIPVTFTGIPIGTDIGAVTMNIAFDSEKLQYLNALNPNGAQIDVTGNMIHVAWSSTMPVIVNGVPFITFNFNYAASGNAPALIEFRDGCQIAGIAKNGTILHANWNNGGVNAQTTWTISGKVEYNSAPLPNQVLPFVTVYVKDGPQPLPPATTPVPNIIATTTADNLGNFTVSVPNGNYWLYASDTAAWAGVDQGDVINLRRYIAGLPPNSMDGNPLRILAGDINQDGVVDNGDVIPLRRHIGGLTPNPNYLAPDWMYQNPNVIVNNANQTGILFLGICSGDVNGTYPN